MALDNIVPLNSFPSQKKPTKAKTPQWRKDCIRVAENIILSFNEQYRKSLKTKRINYNLYSDILDQTDVERTCNPRQLDHYKSPAKMQNYPISNPKIDLLVGESIKRRFDWKVRVINDDAISKKEQHLKSLFENMMTRHITQDMTEEQVQKELKDFNRFKTYEYQDLRERRATQILRHLYTKLRLDYVFSKGFKDALICAEEIYLVDVVAGEPILERLNPLNVYTLRSGESPFIEDSDIIVVVGYHAPGSIIDAYHEELTSNEIDRLENGLNASGTQGKLGIDIGRFNDLTLKLEGAIADTFMNYESANYGSPIDLNGNIRVTKVYWKSMRKMLSVKYFDEFGDQQESLEDENYKIDKSKGETSEEIWISEWWEGHKIGGGLGADESAIYKRMRPKPVQFRSMENPSKCSPGIIGTIYNTNDNEAVSLMDRMKPYQYLYNILAYNTELMIAKNKGKIMSLDLASIPEHWEVETWLSYAESMNIAVKDSFKEGNKGIAEGKLAGAMQQNNPVIDMEMGNTIQQYISMMQYIKQELGEISGVSQARQGQISNREAVSNVEREVTQSSHITEYWFLEHDFVKMRAMGALLEMAKYAWKDKKNKKVQHVLDDGSTEIFEIDGEEFNEIDYDIAITDGANSAELLNSLKQLAHAGIQNGIINFSQLMDIYSSDSMSSIRRKIQAAEEEKLEMDKQKNEQQQKINEQTLNAQAVEAEKERNFTREGWSREDARAEKQDQTKVLIEQMKINNQKEELPEDNSPDYISLEQLRQSAQKIQKDNELKDKQLAETARHNKVVEQQKDKEISIKKTQKKAPKS